MRPSTPRKPATRLRTLARWALAIFVSLAFLGAGLPKLLGIDAPGGSFADFERWGYPVWFRYAVGAGETLAAVLLLLPRPAIFGAIPRFWASVGLAIDMAGAIGTHLVHGEAMMLPFPATLLGLSVLLALVSRPTHLALASRRAAPANGDAP